MSNIVCDSNRLIKNCRVCDSNELELVIDLKHQPWCGNFLKKNEIGMEPFYPLQVVFCHVCQTPQLNYTVPKEVMFSDHTYLSNITKTLNDHFQSIAEEINEKFFKNTSGKSILDIGSNDGAQLSYFKKLNFDVLGVESAKTPADIANANGISTTHAFFNLDFVRNLNRKFHVINASGVFFHLEELHSVAEAIRESLLPEGVFTVQFLYMKKILENMAFDQIYHEHLLYYNLKNIETLLNRHGLSMFDAYISPIHGGSIIGFITHRNKARTSEKLKSLRNAEIIEKTNEMKTYKDFANRINIMKEKNLEYLNEGKKQGKKIFGFSAPAKGNTLLNHFGIGNQYLDCLVEKNELRGGLYSPGSHLPIVIERELKISPDIYYVLAWNFKKEILEKNKELIASGVEFYFPVNPKDM